MKPKFDFKRGSWGLVLLTLYISSLNYLEGTEVQNIGLEQWFLTGVPPKF